MAVAILNDWAGLKVGSAPNGPITIDSGSDRLTFCTYIVETGGTHTYTSITLGGEAPTGTLVEESSASPDQFIWSWFWNETAVAAAIATSASPSFVLTKSGTPSSEVWDYITFSGASDGATFATSGESASANTLEVTTTSATSVNDWLIVAINRSSANRDMTDYDTLTEGWQHNTGYTAAVADGSGGDDATQVTGDGIAGDIFMQLLHIKAASALGAQMIIHQHQAMLGCK